MKRRLLLSVCKAGLLLAALAVLGTAPQAASAGTRGGALPFAEAQLPLSGVRAVTSLDTTVFTAVADAYVSSALPSKNYGAAQVLYAGSQTAAAPRRALFRFVLSSLPSEAVVDSAYFQANLTETPSAPPTVLNIGAFRITSGWDEAGVTWSNQPTAVPIGRVTGVGVLPQFYSWEVTSLVRALVSDPGINYGIELRSQAEGTADWRGFSSREAASAYRPQLVVQHHLPLCTDAQEPNDTFAQAFPIAPAVEYLGCIPASGDVDLFRFDVDPSTARSVQVELYSLPANFDLYLYGPGPTLVDSSANAGTSSESVAYTTGPAGRRFYAEVQATSGGDPDNPYALKLTLTADATPPQILSGPAVSSITSSAASSQS
ncbi:MAG: PPC domain-containing protein [Anaerolineae bacterium]|nr:PPC domain-containing protein [Anaerolineae bacterium]